MSGNVWELTLSLWREGQEDVGESSNMLRVVRGGAFFHESRVVRCAFRFGVLPDNRTDLIGFRVVVAPFPSGL